MSRYQALQDRVDAVAAAGLQRKLMRLTMTDPVTGTLDGRSVTVFCSNDYLGLAHHPDVVNAFQGSGAGASRLISGNRPAHEDLEAHLERLYGRPATLFSSGYHANLALMSTVVTEEDRVASDALNHASIIDGLRLSKATRQIVPHGSPSAIPSGSRMVVVEGVYSMDGDVLDLPAYEGDHWLAVDEAHAFGVVGPHGLGAAASMGVEPDFIIGTLGKAIGTYGAFVVGPPELKALLISQGRSFMFTTGLPEPVVRASLVALTLATDERRAALQANVARFRTGLQDLGIDALGSTHIVPVLMGRATMAVAERLMDRGHWAAGIRAPTVAPGSERVRFTVSAAHTAEQIDRLLSDLAAVLKEIRHDHA
ncbi:MAG: 8-amino-7-oxononanoate synthase [Myxococcota bacterium]|nr:8-amino-7-oxononanoate synthase [Myxococcota bacterium]